MTSQRKVLSLAVAACCHEAGFSTAEESVIEILTVMLQSLITEAARGSQMFAEHNGRSEVTFSDVFLSLVEMGLNVESILEFAKKRNLFRIPTPAKEAPQNQPTILQAGQPRPLHSYIQDHYPKFPAPHTYIRTPTYRQPITEYEAIRDKAATQKRDIEKALTRFVAKASASGPDHSLFPKNDDLNKHFQLISIQSSPLPFLDALLPRDQIFDDCD